MLNERGATYQVAKDHHEALLKALDSVKTAVVDKLKTQVEGIGPIFEALAAAKLKEALDAAQAMLATNGVPDVVAPTADAVYRPASPPYHPTSPGYRPDDEPMEEDAPTPEGGAPPA